MAVLGIWFSLVYMYMLNSVYLGVLFNKFLYHFIYLCVFILCSSQSRELIVELDGYFFFVPFLSVVE